MHTITHPAMPVSLHSQGGHIHRYLNLETAVETLSAAILDQLGATLDDVLRTWSEIGIETIQIPEEADPDEVNDILADYYGWGRHAGKAAFVLRDHWGDPIDPDDVRRMAAAVSDARRARRRRARHGVFVYRAGPVPNTGKNSGVRGAYCSSKTIMSEFRRAVPEDGVAVRAKRGRRALRPGWSDLWKPNGYRSDTRCWKSQRKNRWKQPK
jgi:hypothetical protein